MLADDAARAEVVAPIASAIVTSNGLPPDQQPFVTAQVDRVLRDPAGARAFIDPFAGSWARMLGEDDPRPTEFDLAPLVDVLVASTPGLDAAGLPTDRFVVPAVPLPRSDVPAVGATRRAISAATIPLALLALAGFLVGVASADRRWAMRRFGLWAVMAGAAWVMAPAVATWAARRWASGADAVIAVAVEEGVSGLRPTALVLVFVGLAVFAGSFVIPASIARSAPDRPQRPQPTPARERQRPSAAQTPATTTAMMPTSAPIARPSAPARAAMERTTALPNTRATPPDQRTGASAGDGDPPDGSDPLWDFYS